MNTSTIALDKKYPNWIHNLIRFCSFFTCFLVAIYVPYSDSATKDEKNSGNSAILRNAISDMDKDHEALPNGGGPGWNVKPLISMGALPYASSIPNDWQGVRYPEWKAILPWFLIYQEKGANNVVNSSVEIQGFQLFVFLKKEQKWYKIGESDNARWASAMDLNAHGPKSDIFKFNTEDGVFYRPSDSFMIHGGLKQFDLPWDAKNAKANISAVFVSIRHRLKMINKAGPNDSKDAKFLVLVGADYYPFMGATLKDLKAAYNPGAGLGRFISVKKEWNYSTFVVKEGGTKWSSLLRTPPQITDLQ